MAITKEQAIDILDKFDFFQGQRAGRDLWNDKPFDVQEQDINSFSRDVGLLKEYIADVAPKGEVVQAVLSLIDEKIKWETEMQESFRSLKGSETLCQERIDALKNMKLIINHHFRNEIQKKYTEEEHDGS